MADVVGLALNTEHRREGSASSVLLKPQPSPSAFRVIETSGSSWTSKEVRGGGGRGGKEIITQEVDA